MKRLAVCIHVFYTELLPEIAKCVDSFAKFRTNIFVTTPLNNEKTRQDIFQALPSCHLQVVENRGYDVGPFFRSSERTKSRRL